MTILTAGEVAALLVAIEPPYAPIFALCAYAGLRISEACAVQVDDLDLKAMTLHVQRQVGDRSYRHPRRNPNEWCTSRRPW
ncbi:hypothetical protein EDL96_09835 [Kocuria soli]|uniref:Tyr recombinase domain-containing protein n=1 Tax=Kocuria soli TaxID=2485125 RepID=A0A3N3ZNM5_9MICC|nr:hypothetical protein EDL96_09835 [Kocuria soli]